MMEKAELNQLVSLYFNTVHHYGVLGFIHPPSFYRLLEAGKAPRELTAVMIACTLRFACDPTPETLGRADALVESNRRVILEYAYDRYGAVELMAMVLTRLYEYSRGNFSSAWMLWGNAVRMMQFLSLHTFDQTYANTPSLRQNPLLKREALRRLAWCIFYQDTCVDAGQHGVHLLDESGFHIQLPCDEASFLRDVEVPTALLNPTEAHADQSSVLLGRNPYDPEPHLGLSAHLIRTGNMRRRILHYRSRVRYSTESPEDMLRHMTLVERDLRQLIAQLPSDLAYTEQNLFVHASDRPAFVLLHLVRHNCFLMLALTRLNICARDPGLEERSRAFRRDRIRHALPVSNIVADILRLQVQCDPNIGAHAYTSLEIMLFDPLHLSRTDASVDPGADKFKEALKRLMDLIRREAPRHEIVRNLRLEACRRLVHFGFQDLLTPSDRNACASEVGFAGRPNSDEFDFLSMPWNRFNQSKGSRDLPGTPGTEGMLHRGRAAAVVSRGASPFGGGIDAEAVSRQSAALVSGPDNEDQGDEVTVPNVPLTVPELLSMSSTNIDLAASTDVSHQRVSYTPLDQPQPIPLAPEEFVFPFELSPDGLAQQNRWVDLNYGFGLDLDPIDSGWGWMSTQVNQSLPGEGEGGGAGDPVQSAQRDGGERDGGETREFTDLFDWPSSI
ncbi:hypothetical protein JCM24511_02371 [Saitozyma sp. JCM 24511]|nr:hypothetical protein JCM24511_02371 [Saitozyma sp. JCM 24511]